MADQKAKYVPGSRIVEVASNNEYMYVEAKVALKLGDEIFIDQFGRADKIPETVKVGAWIAPAVAFENIPQGQFGNVLVKGATAAQTEGLKIRAEAVFEKDKVIDTQNVTGKLQSITKTVPLAK